MTEQLAIVAIVMSFRKGEKMTKDKILKIISGLCVGIGVGACFGVAMHNIVVGLLFGLSIGICFAVTFVCVGRKK